MLSTIALKGIDHVKGSQMRSLDPRHPVVRVVLVLRLWLLLVMGIMLLNAWVGRGYLIGRPFDRLPFLFFAAIALVWMFYAWCPNIVIVCSSALTVGTLMRGIEVVAFADTFTVQQRIVGFSLWGFISGTALACGVLSLVASSRKDAEDWVFGRGDRGGGRGH